MRNKWKQMLVGLIFVAGAFGVTQIPAGADASVIDLPAGLACPGFALRITGFGRDHTQQSLHDRGGQPVFILDTGKGQDLLFTNLATGKTYAIAANGSNDKTTILPDGTTLHDSTGHNVISLFPTDNPPGPTTIQYIGRVSYLSDASGNFTFLSTSGTQNDICAQLS